MKKCVSRNKGGDFFCYSSNEETRAFIEAQVLPHIGPTIVILFRTKLGIISPRKYKFVVYHIFSDNVNDKKLPLLLRIVAGSILSVSLHDALYMNYKKEDGADRFMEEFNKARAHIEHLTADGSHINRA